MVWPAPGSAGGQSAPRRRVNVAGIPGETAPASRPKKKSRKPTMFSTLTGTFFPGRSRTMGDGDDQAGSSRGLLETLLLLAALVGIGGLIVYLVWPPGQEYLYKHAEALMASTHRSDWVKARDEYLEPLDRRFPNNPYREQTARWRDKILLDEAESRSVYLAADRVTVINEPKTNAERLFVFTNGRGGPGIQAGDDLAAVSNGRRWRRSLKPDDKDDRPWYLLAVQRAEQLEAAMRDRRQFVETQTATGRRGDARRPSQPGHRDPQPARRAVRGLYGPGGPVPRRPPRATRGRPRAGRAGRRPRRGRGVPPRRRHRPPRRPMRRPNRNLRARPRRRASPSSPDRGSTPLRSLYNKLTNGLTSNSVVND